MTIFFAQLNQQHAARGFAWSAKERILKTRRRMTREREYGPDETYYADIQQLRIDIVLRWGSHIGGSKPKNPPQGRSYCAPCGRNIGGGSKGMQDHCQGKSHQQNVANSQTLVVAAAPVNLGNGNCLVALPVASTMTSPPPHCTTK